jgi:hypothetical protein
MHTEITVSVLAVSDDGYSIFNAGTGPSPIGAVVVNCKKPLSRERDKSMSSSKKIDA